MTSKIYPPASTDRQARLAPVEVLPGIWISGAPNPEELLAIGPNKIVCLCRTPVATGFAETLQLPFPFWEMSAARIEDTLARIVDFLQKSDAGVSLIHCRLGRDRSGFVALSLLLRSGDSLSAAIARYKRDTRRPLPRFGAIHLLRTIGRPSHAQL
ncbi:tyrosine-protein phosphatase [Massilia sp. P8910]|uniref:protein-tyrosine phosphatase family protein n=1 Tax=Massilia TaxID=149698 RepID=UPI0006BDA0D0|nr:MULTISPECIES: tyrosine-protein phosphatase [Massilia]CUI05718.1 hypothetical protein BN2497_6213 [Janthinobacterium sp. CG23_2]MCE3607294.1 tyrosine-protein phosphatase [Massilia antarctica]MCY0915228.1 tyrosine-protein phosphatase [Massilia sp. H27-R4]MDM5177266.1 tyrosine-protein phosphatase [Massilia sp. DJPM01]CUU29504.1 hypothetical protein BN3177_6213 [Janthinobacterium sp. CG23_2]